MFLSILISALTPTERRVVSEVVSGKANKCIASDLILSQRTIEAHRANVFQKMQVRNAIELTRLLKKYKAKLNYVPQLGPVWLESSSIGSTSG